MNVKSLKVFCDVVGRRSFSRAADENGISQSGASQMVHHLEEELGVRLLDRSKRPFVLTAEGKVYYEGCRKLVQKFYALEEEVKTLHQEVEGRVNIASIYSIGLTHLRAWSREFTDRYTRANVFLDCHHPDLVYELVENNQVDFGLVSYPKSSRTISGTIWSYEPYVLVCSPEHPWAIRGDLRLAEMNSLEMVGFDAGLKARQELDRELGSRKVSVQVAMAFDNTATIKSAIENYEGIGLLPEPTVAREIARGTLVNVPVVGLDLTRPIGLIKRRGIELGKTARRFIQETQASLNEDSEGSAAQNAGQGWSQGSEATGGEAPQTEQPSTETAS